MRVTKQDAAIFERIRQLRDTWQALPPGDARIAAIRNDFMPWVGSLLQDLGVHTAMAEIALHAAAGVTGDDREARRVRLLKGYPAMLGVLRPILPTSETDLFIGDLKAMDQGRAPFALYPRERKQVDKRRHEIEERCVLRAEYDAGLLGISRSQVLGLHNVPDKPQLPVSRLNRWAMRRVTAEQKQLFHGTGEKKRTGVALSAEEQKALEAVERNTLDELIRVAIDAGNMSGSRPRSRSPSIAASASDQGGDGDGTDRG